MALTAAERQAKHRREQRAREARSLIARANQIATVLVPLVVELGPILTRLQALVREGRPPDPRDGETADQRHEIVTPESQNTVTNRDSETAVSASRLAPPRAAGSLSSLEDQEAFRDQRESAGAHERDGRDAVTAIPPLRLIAGNGVTKTKASRVSRASRPLTECPPSDSPEVPAFSLTWGLDQRHPEFVAFVDNHAAKGSRMRDWRAAWRTWLRRSEQYAARDASRTQGRSVAHGTSTDASHELAEMERTERATEASTRRTSPAGTTNAGAAAIAALGTTGGRT